MLLGGSLSQLWSALNCQQMISHFPLFAYLKFPENANSLNEYFLMIGQFNFIDTAQKVDRLIFDLPDAEPYNEGFRVCHYESTLLVTNMSFMVWVYIINLVGLIFTFCFIRRMRVRPGRLARLKKKCMGYFFWNGLIRLFMETFFELILSALVNLHAVDLDSSYPGVKYSNVLTFVSLILIGLLVTSLNLLYCCNFRRLAEKRFRGRYGAGYDGTNPAKKVSPMSVLVYPLSFFVRRILFALSAVYFPDFLWS